MDCPPRALRTEVCPSERYFARPSPVLASALPVTRLELTGLVDEHFAAHPASPGRESMAWLLVCALPSGGPRTPRPPWSVGHAYGQQNLSMAMEETRNETERRVKAGLDADRRSSHAATVYVATNKSPYEVAT
ncbi:hypothetical protein FRC08_018185 [Ceratobasidium sp. 394]|nr:hypothetical protein FRC08_018185 [Ceratobasidium sp. 394]KAG9093534.1 hypothetical protein FS749_014221 [Ceratobasidium sp. UAMH 11750]